jgi:PAS domain S-box-containing protein
MLSRRQAKDNNIHGKREQSGELLRHLGMFTQLANEGIATFDLKGTLHFVNMAWAKMHGYKSSEELLGKKISFFHTKDQMKSDVIPFMEETKRKGSATGAIEHVQKDGTTFPTRMKTSLLRDEKGQANGLIVIITDITEYRRLEESAIGLSKQDNELKEQIEKLQHQIGEHKQAEENLKQEAAKLTAANEQLQQQTGSHDQAQASLKQQTAELTTYNKQLKQQIGEQEKVKEDLKQQAANLTAVNEQLQHQIAEREQAEKNLKQEAAELTAANEQLKDKVIEHDLVEESLKQEAAKITTTNEQLQQQITEHEQVEESLKQQAAELTAANEQLQRQVGEHDKADEGQKQQVAALKSANEQLQKQIVEERQIKTDLMKHLNMITEAIVDMQNKTSKSSGGREREVADTDDVEELGKLALPLDVEKLKSIAEMAKRLR